MFRVSERKIKKISFTCPRVSFAKKRNKDRNTLLSIRSWKVVREKRHYSRFRFDHVVFLFTDFGSLLTLRHISLFTSTEFNVTFVRILFDYSTPTENRYKLFSALLPPQAFIKPILYSFLTRITTLIINYFSNASFLIQPN